MLPVKFKTRKRRPNYDLEFTVARIAEICCGHQGSKHRFRNDNGTYVLSGGNDWFLRPDDEMLGESGVKSVQNDGVVDEIGDDDFRYWELEYRYGGTPERAKALEGLTLFLEYTLGN